MCELEVFLMTAEAKQTSRKVDLASYEGDGLVEVRRNLTGFFDILIQMDLELKEQQRSEAPND